MGSNRVRRFVSEATRGNPLEQNRNDYTLIKAKGKIKKLKIQNGLRIQ
jgi:hypothetical protein